MSDFVIENGVLTKYIGPGGDVTIPEGVTEIGERAFWGNYNIKSVCLPENLSSIGNSAFQDNCNLESIAIPKVVSIGSWAFMGCSSLKSVVIADGTTMIGKDAFNNCTSLNAVSLPSTLEKIGASVFSGCTGLSALILPKSVADIGAMAFSGCASLNLSIQEGNPHFKICDGLLLSVDGKKLYFCMPNTESVSIPETVKTIVGGAFAWCGRLTSITIPDGVTTIEHRAFSYCKQLSEITIPASVKKVGDRAFLGSTKLKRLINLSSVPIASLLDENTSLEDGYLPGEVLTRLKPTYKQNAAVCYLTNPSQYPEKERAAYEDYIKKQNTALLSRIAATANQVALSNLLQTGYVKPAAAKKAAEETADVMTRAVLMEYCNAKGNPEKDKKQVQKQLKLELPKAEKKPTQTEILKEQWQTEKAPDGTLVLLRYRGTDTDVVIPDKIGRTAVTIIGYNTVFATRPGFPQPKTVTIPGSMRYIGALAFGGCTEIKELVIPEGVTRIGSIFIRGCTSLSKIVLPASVNEIAYDAFKDGPNVTIYAPAGSYAERYAKENNIPFEAI